MASENQQMPVIFVGHGSPMNIVEDNEFTRSFKNIGNQLIKPKAILAISAHWLTQGTVVQNSVSPKVIYDFSGFPEELYKIKYPAVGDPKTAETLSKKFPDIVARDEWGIDHGTWSVLVHMFPNHDIPVLQMSINKNLSFKEHFELAKELKFLRQQGVLILGSGNIVHNLYQIKWDPNSKPFDWTIEFDQKIRNLISQGDYSAVVEIAKNDSALFQVAHPSYEHFLPLLYTLGAAGDKANQQVLSSGTQNGSISMTSFMFA